MLLIPCPWCGSREQIEFRHAGDAHLLRQPGAATSDSQWIAFLYERSNPRGAHLERWYHVHGCGQYFNVERDTLSDRIARSYFSDVAGQAPPT